MRGSRDIELTPVFACRLSIGVAVEHSVVTVLLTLVALPSKVRRIDREWLRTLGAFFIGGK